MTDKSAASASQRPADWKLPRGVAPGTWDYAHTPQIADRYDAFLEGTALTALDLRFLDEILPPSTHAGQIVGDLGCGTGRTADLIASRGYRMLGIDLSQSMLRHLASRTPGATGPAMALRANLVTLQCLADGVLAHAVCLFSTLGMVRGRENRRRVIAHAFRLIAPGGLLVVHAHNRWAALRDPGGVRHLWQSWRRSLAQSEADFGDRVYAYRGLPNMFLHSYGRRELLADLHSGGFRVERLVPLAVRGDSVLSSPRWLAGLRAGGFVAVGRRP